MFNDIATLREQIHAFQLDRLEEKIVSLAQPSIRMTRTPIRDDSLPMGASKLGGHPDLPPNFQWQYYGAKPLTFIGQFKLSELTPHDTLGVLPPHGMLYFFYQADEMPWGQSEEREGWQVVYIVDENAPLVRTAHPTYQGEWGMTDALPAHRIAFLGALSLPAFLSDAHADFDHDSMSISKEWTEEQRRWSSGYEVYWKLLELSTREPYHFWLGHPRLIQYYIRWDVGKWSVVTQNQNIMSQKNTKSNEYHYSDEQIAHILSAMTKWQFLFQIDTDDSLGLTGIYGGTLYVYIPKTSLATKRFEDCWTIMQCS